MGNNTRNSISFQSNSATSSYTGQGGKRPSTASFIRRVSTSSRRLSSKASIRPKVDLLHILQKKTKSPISLPQFRQFMEDVEHGAESLNFWEDVERLKEVENRKRAQDLEEGKDGKLEAEMKNLVDTIVGTYLKQGSIQELNITSTARKEVLAALAADPPPEAPSTIFLNIQKHCFELMSLNSLPRFLTEAMKNIDARGRKFRFWMVAVPGAIAMIILTAIAWTLPSFERRHRWTTIVPAAIFFLGFWQSYLAFCICRGATGTAEVGGKIIRVQETCVRISHRRRTFYVVSLMILCTAAWGCMVYYVPLNVG